MKKFISAFSLAVVAATTLSLASAETFDPLVSQCAGIGCESYGSCIFTVNPNKSSYTAGEAVTLTGSAYGSGGGASLQTKCDAVLASTAAVIVSGPGMRDWNWSNSGSASTVAGASSGSFAITLTAAGNPGPANQRTDYVSYTVAAPTPTVEVHFTDTLKNFLNLFVSALGFDHAYAQNAPVQKSATLIANVHLTDSKIVQNTDGSYQLSFTLETFDEAQADLKSGYSLMEGNNTVYSYTFDKTISLRKGVPVRASEKITLPKGLSGTFKVVAQAMTTSGLPLGVGIAGEVALKGEAVPTVSCTPGKEMYKKDAAPTVMCEVKGSDAAKYTLGAALYEGTSPVEVSRTESAIATKGKTTLSFKAVTMPGSYTAQVGLYENKIAVGAQVPVTFKVDGVSATILNLRLDRDMYEVNDVAKVTTALRINGSLASTTLNVKTMLSGDSGSCANTKSQPVTEKMVMETSLVITQSCKNPKLTVEVADPSGMKFAEKTLSLTTVEKPVAPEHKFVTLNTILAIIIAAVLGVALVFLRRARSAILAPKSMKGSVPPQMPE